MAKIRNANPKNSSGGFVRMIGNEQLATIFTKAQSTVITNGTELEKIITERAKPVLDLDKFIEDCENLKVENGTYLCSKKVVKASSYKLAHHEPDFLALTVNVAKNICYVVELKDGFSFDTKKSVAEKEMLQVFVNHIAPKIPFRTKYYICCFNQSDKDMIENGFKGVFSSDEILTGREFCEILGIDYDAIVNMRNKDCADNLQYVLEKLTEIKEVCDAVTSVKRKRIIENEFYD